VDQLGDRGRPVLTVLDGHLTVVASVEDGDPRPHHIVTILDGNAVVATVEPPYPDPNFDFDLGRPIEVGDVTGDGRHNDLVPFSATGPIGAVVTEDGGEGRTSSAHARSTARRPSRACPGIRTSSTAA
jgi:hypothetical protein